MRAGTVYPLRLILAAVLGAALQLCCCATPRATPCAPPGKVAAAPGGCHGRCSTCATDPAPAPGAPDDEGCPCRVLKRATTGERPPVIAWSASPAIPSATDPALFEHHPRPPVLRPRHDRGAMARRDSSLLRQHCALIV